MKDLFCHIYTFYFFSLKSIFSSEYGQAESLAGFKAKADVSYMHNLLSFTGLTKRNDLPSPQVFIPFYKHSSCNYKFHVVHR